jgi:hypothetical protein
MFQTKVAEKIKTHFYVQELSFGNHAVCLIMWKNTVEPGRPQMTVWLMSIVWLQTHTQEYVTLTAFPLQQWSNESASMLRYTYIVRLVYACRQ